MYCCRAGRASTLLQQLVSVGSHQPGVFAGAIADDVHPHELIIES